MRSAATFISGALACATLCSGCASTGFLMAKPQVVMYMPAGIPKPIDYPIRIYHVTAPESPYEEIAQISVGDTNDEWCMTKIMEKAREIGADAVIMTGRVGSYSLATASGQMRGSRTYVGGMEAQSAYGMSAIAIRFTE